MSLKVQLHNGHKPISNHAAAKRGNNFASHLLSCTALVILWQYSEPDLPVSASERWSAQKVRENSAAQPFPPPPPFVNTFKNFGLNIQQLKHFSAL